MAGPCVPFRRLTRLPRRSPERRAIRTTRKHRPFSKPPGFLLTAVGCSAAPIAAPQPDAPDHRAAPPSLLQPEARPSASPLPPSGARRQFNEDGSANWMVAAFIMAYTMIEIWVILQV